MIEQKVAETLLQKEIVATLSGKTYKVAPPCMATLVLMSEQIGFLIKGDLNNENFLENVFNNVEHAEKVAKSFAIMIIGAKELKKTNFWSRKLENLTQEIMFADINDVAKEYVRILFEMGGQSFFQLITFLSDINLTKPTQKVI